MFSLSSWGATRAQLSSRQKRIAFFSIVAPLSWVTLSFASCSSVDSTSPVRLGESAAALTASTNYNVTGTNYAYHETSAVSVQYQSVSGGLAQRWVVGFNSVSGNNCSGDGCNRLFGWSYSTDLDGTSWTPNFQSSNTQWGSPAGRDAADGHPFGGLLGDPSLAPIYDTTISNYQQRIIYTSIGNSTVTLATDVVALLSNDGGETWGHPQFVNTAATGTNIDNPVIASHSASPYGTYVAWLGNGTTQISKINYSSTFVFSASAPSTVPVGSSGAILHPAIAVGQLANCDGTHEAVYLAWATAAGRCPNSSGPNIVANSWWFAVYDTVKSGGTWYGPWEAESDTNWPNCVGNPLDVNGGDNDPRPRLAVDPSGTSLWIAHTQSSTYGTRISVDPERLVCSGGVVQPEPGGTPLRPQDPCYRLGPTGAPDCYGPDGGIVGGNGPDGGVVVNDEWGPAIAYLYNSMTSSSELTVTWYDTRGDQNNRNVAIWGASGINGANPFDSMYTVAYGTGVPWDHTAAGWWDYQAIGVDLTNYAFLGAWGGDARSGATQAGIWSARIQ